MTNKKTQTLEFSAETGKLLNLMIHSLYTNKEIFLRELLSNASDACDKLRYELNVSDKLAKNFKDYQFKINVTLDKKNKIITIADNGIGMSYDEMVANLGTIAKSGTQNFLEELDNKEKNTPELIGQFGVGFYSAFMVAKNIKVVSNKADSQDVFEWESEGTGKFTIKESDKKHRGTEITLYLKDDAEQYLDKFHIQHLIKTYSDHIAFPIELATTEKDDKAEIANSTKAIWNKNKSQIKKDEYNAFYKTLSHAVDEPYLTIHNKVEGTVEYTNLLYVPTNKPFDVFHPDRKCQVKLYVKKVFVTEDNAPLIPAYLRFLRGIVDSQDLPLNINRETLQDNAVINKIQTSLTKKILSELKKAAAQDKEKYQNFWINLGAVLKEGLCEYNSDRETILDLCLFKSSKSGNKYISLKEYCDNMAKDQKDIYYLIGNDATVMQNSPQIEAFKAKDIEVLFLTDGVDDFWLTTTTQYQDKDFKSVTKTNLDLDKLSDKDDKKADKKETEQQKELIAFFKENLKDHVSDVTISHKLTSSPVCLAAAANGMDIRMERILLDQGQLKESTKKILEINPNHAIILELEKRLKTDPELVKKHALTLFDQACIIEGEIVNHPVDLAQRMSNLLEGSLAS